MLAIIQIKVWLDVVFIMSCYEDEKAEHKHASATVFSPTDAMVSN